MIRNLTAFFVAVFWLATAYWVYKDARRRIEDPWLVGMATVLGLIPPFVGPLDLHALPAARVPRGRARARARDQGDGAAARAARPALPGLPRRGRGGLPRLPGLHDEAEAVVRQLQAAARGALAGLPVLRDAGRAHRRRVARPDAGARPAAPRTQRRRLGAAMAVERTLVLDQARRGPARAGRRDPRALRAPRARDARRPARPGRPRARRGALRRARARSRSSASWSSSSPRRRRSRWRSRASRRSRSSARRWAPPTRPSPRPGTIRGDLALAMPDNLVHGSDSPESSAQREIALWFGRERA